MASGIDAMRKTIREKEPMRPSTRFATLKGEDLTTTAKRRSVDKAKLMHQLKGDLGLDRDEVPGEGSNAAIRDGERDWRRISSAI